ncbi:hypothetical protein SEA_MORGANA_78 [Gordonia phage Morgana]|uniref:HNH endonuclease n=1 Tax=Gordonia phage Morgana TaxID=3137292 RepID=A0AAX4RB33_9CAUD
MNDLPTRARHALHNVGTLPIVKATNPDGTARVRQPGRPLVESMPHNVARFLMQAHEILVELSAMTQTPEQCRADGGHHWKAPVPGRRNECVECGYRGLIFEPYYEPTPRSDDAPTQ